MDDMTIPQPLNRMFHALGSRPRLNLLNHISASPRTVASTIAKQLHMELQTFSYHLSILEDAGLVRRIKVGRYTVPSLRNSEVTKLSNFLLDLLSNNEYASEKDIK